MKNYSEIVNPKVLEILELIENNQNNDLLIDYWNKIKHHYDHYLESYIHNSNVLDETNAMNILRGCEKHYSIISELINQGK